MIAQVISHHAAALIGVHIAEIYGRSHRRRPALARHLVWFILHERFAWDYSSIAREFNRERQPVMRAVEGLPPKTREVFVMCRVRGLSHREIAALMGISTKTVEKHMTAALKHLTLILRSTERGRH